jgi:hypothetical protein
MACKQEPPGAKPFLPGLIKAQMLYQSNNTPAAKAANVLHGRWSDSVNHPQADLNGWASALNSAWNADITTLFTADWSYLGCVVSSLGGDGLVANNTASTPGSFAGTSFPPQVAVCISWKAPLTARGGRARTYLPGIPTTATTSTKSPVLTSTYAGDVKAQAAAILSAMSTFTASGVNGALGVPSYYHSCQLRPVPLFFYFSAAVVHDRLDSQRRRSGKEALFGLT